MQSPLVVQRTCFLCAPKLNLRTQTSDDRRCLVAEQGENTHAVHGGYGAHRRAFGPAVHPRPVRAPRLDIQQLWFLCFARLGAKVHVNDDASTRVVQLRC